VVTTLEHFQRIADKHRHVATDTLLKAVEFYARFYSGLYSHVAKTPGCFAHDLLAFIYLVQPGLFTTTVKSVRVATEGLAQGQTIMNERDFIDYPQPGWEKTRHRTQVCMQVDAPGCLAVFEETMLADWLPA
ncbi:MAG: nucleoside hydrolase, partial [Rhodoferax sp.]|nr:nucleoside hydrolase [Rhodoferax sp.]